MFTVCPKCSLTLGVTAADLRVAQGYVRCGRCSNVFNALGALSDERQQAPAEVVTQEPLAREPPPPLPPEAIEPEPTAQELEFDPAATSVEEVFVVERPIGDSESTGTFEAIVLEEDPAHEADQDEDIPAAPDASPPSTATDSDEELKRELQTLAERIDATSNRRQISEAFEEFSPREEDEPEPGSPWLWYSGIAALLLLLIAQTAHHYRHDLALNPRLNAILTRLYSSLGVSLEPRWDLKAYEVRQLGATSDPQNADRLIVRASIKNNAPRPQPVPTLRVAVQDRFGNRIAARDVAPAMHAKLASGERLDTELRFIDPGKDAVGFEIEACLAAPGGGVNCANP